MANTTTRTPAHTLPVARAETTTPSRPRLNISFFTTLVYLFMTIGALLFVMPFFWMVSTSLMSQAETAQGNFLPRSELIGIHPVTPADLERPMSDFLDARADFNFQGKSATIIYEALPDGGVFDVYIDDLYLTSVDTASETRERRTFTVDSYPAIPTLSEAQAIPLPGQNHHLRLAYNADRSSGTQLWIYGVQQVEEEAVSLQFGYNLPEVNISHTTENVLGFIEADRTPYGNWETVTQIDGEWEQVTWHPESEEWRADNRVIAAADVTWRATHLGFPNYIGDAVRNTISASAGERSEGQEFHIRQRAFGGYAVMSLLGNDYVVTGGASNYVKVWNDSNFGAAFVNSVLVTSLTILGQTIFSIMAAYAFARMQFPGRNVLFMIFLMTLFVPVMVILIPNVLTMTDINRWSLSNIGPIFETLGENVFFLGWIGLDETDAAWINNWPGLVTPFWASTFSIFLLRQFFLQIPDELWDASQIDGAGHLRFLFQVVVPISRAAIMTTVLFTFIGTWDALEWPILIAPDESWKPIAVALYEFQSNEGARPNLVMAGAMISLLPVIVVYLITQKQFTEGIATTGLKG